MKRKTTISSLLFLLATLLVLASAAQAADATLPQSEWYAVAWVESTDTLHWVNAGGEQASIPRPKLEGQISQAQTRLHISPDGRYLVVISPLLNGREGIGFYNFQTGQFVQVHESQPNEVFLPAGRQPYSEFSAHFVVPLRNQITGDWRMIVFEAATGNVVAQLNRTDPNMPLNFITDTAWWPSVVQFNVDEALNILEVRFQFVTQPNAMPPSFSSFKWSIPAGNVPTSVTPDALPFSQQAGLDINPVTGEIVFASFENGAPPSPSAANTISYQASSGDPPQVLASEPAGSARLPLWLNDGEWIGYYGNNGAFADHWTVMTAGGQSALPVSPEIISIYHTRDGFLSKNSSAWRLDHATSLDLEGFAEPVGATIFQPGVSFAVVYTTPASTLFALPSVAEPFVSPAGPDDLQAPQPVTCPGAPVPRLTVGGNARVAFTDGSPLNIRVEPAGNLLTQIPEGTVVSILDGPACGEGYLYWHVQAPNNIVGWAAEGSVELYFLEPYDDAEPQNDLPLAAPPTVTPPVVTLVADVDIALPAPEPTAGLNIVAVPVVCTQSPPSQLEVGEFAHTVQPDGTLAVRVNLSDEFPTYQLPVNRTVSVVGGPQCRENLRMWQVEMNLNGQQVTGWAAEGYGQIYYLLPGPARAGN